MISALAQHLFVLILNKIELWIIISIQTQILIRKKPKLLAKH
jgi:hypothetical protein